MKLKDFEQLKKFMAMTTSTNEHEMMGGLKMANALLAREGLTWARVLDRSVKVIQEVEAAPESYSEPTVDRNPHSHGRTPTREPVRDTTYDSSAIDDTIDIIERKANLRGDFEDTITDIINQHRAGKQLSFKQRELLLRVASQ